MFKIFLAVIISISFSVSQGQVNYRYSLDLNNIKNNSVEVTLLTPKVRKNEIKFCFPKIIPGTYMISNYGKFISNLKAFDINGASLPISKINTNQWEIKNALKVSKIQYKVEGIFDTKESHSIFPMAATSLEKEDVVINGPGFFGYFDGMHNLPIEVIYNKPFRYYASTSLQEVFSSSNKDIFRVKNIDELYDKPILYCIPDTASVMVGNCKVLFSVYSPGKLIHANEIAKAMTADLNAVKSYLGGSLPANKYAFLYYLHAPSDHKSFPEGLGGALEHTTSSFYFLDDLKPGDVSTNFIVDASLHEFFHIITPLTIASKEIKQFNFDSVVLSKHLWLYEGTTEYNAQYVQARYGLISKEEFLQRLAEKINQSKTQYNDTLPFTNLSKGSADIYNNQYANVYQKGAVIAACLDIYLRNLSDGKYGLRNLTADLSKKYGTDNPFEDDQLFNEIGKMTYPQIKNFLIKYVDQPNAIPYEEYFAMAGVKYFPKIEKQVLTGGKVSFDRDSTGLITVSAKSDYNDFGKAMGYNAGDIIYSFNNVIVNADNIFAVLDSVKSSMHEGDIFHAMVGRKNNRGTIDTLPLSAKIYNVTVEEFNKLAFMQTLTEHQKLVQKAWLDSDNDKQFIAIKNDKY